MGLVGESTHLRPIYLNLQIEVMRLSPSFLQTWNNLHSSPLGPTMSGLSSAFSNLKGRLTYSWYLTPSQHRAHVPWPMSRLVYVSLQWTGIDSASPVF